MKPGLHLHPWNFRASSLSVSGAAATLRDPGASHVLRLANRVNLMQLRAQRVILLQAPASVLLVIYVRGTSKDFRESKRARWRPDCVSLSTVLAHATRSRPDRSFVLAKAHAPKNKKTRRRGWS